jgi:hypothetical protein
MLFTSLIVLSRNVFKGKTTLRKMQMLFRSSDALMSADATENKRLLVALGRQLKVG